MIRPGRNEHTLFVQRETSIRVTLKDGNATIPIGHEFVFHVKDLDGDGTWRGASSDGTTKTVLLTKPSRYEVTFGPLEGYEPIPAQTVTVKSGQTVELTVRLKRRP